MTTFCFWPLKIINLTKEVPLYINWLVLLVCSKVLYFAFVIIQWNNCGQSWNHAYCQLSYIITCVNVNSSLTVVMTVVALWSSESSSLLEWLSPGRRLDLGLGPLRLSLLLTDGRCRLNAAPLPRPCCNTWCTNGVGVYLNWEKTNTNFSIILLFFILGTQNCKMNFFRHCRRY